MFAASIYLYQSGETKEAFTTLEEVTVSSEHQGKYNNILAMWALENDEPQRAVVYADYAVTQGYKDAEATHAAALQLSNGTGLTDHQPTDFTGKNKSIRSTMMR
ncbi:MAG: hypothetical protein WDO15_23100 [Bacteroidota bacterium]